MKRVSLFLWISCIGTCFNCSFSQSLILSPEMPKHYIDSFNDNDNEVNEEYIPNSKCLNFLIENIPMFDCPDKMLERTYYFRWWTYRKHIKKTPEGFVITEFLSDVPWAEKYNTISCAAGHHFYEGRWLRDKQYLNDYANFWFKGTGKPRQYSFWAANSILAYASVSQDKKLVTTLLPFLVENYEGWEKSNLCTDGLFWQEDGSDGMEVSIGGSGKRTTINSYMIGDAKAIATIAHIAGDNLLEEKYRAKASTLSTLLLNKLWDEKASFFKTLPVNSEKLVDARELHGYTPWYFNIPDEKYAVAWNYLLSHKGFKAPYGPTTAEQEHPNFKIEYKNHECQWNGPSWPYATSVTLKALANLLHYSKQAVITKYDFMDILLSYSRSHRRITEDGKEVCWIDENLNPYTGDWISRTRLKCWENGNWSPGKGGVERGKDYNHSAFCDFIISDLIGIQPSMDNSLIIDPLLPENYWDWFCLDNVSYHGKTITLVWDKDGSKYHKVKGFSVYINGVLKNSTKSIGRMVIDL